MSRTNLTDKQKAKSKTWEKATDTMLPWFAPEVPAIGNLTVQRLADEIGQVNELKKDVEKVEKILKERFKSLRGEETVVRGEAYELKVTTQERTAIDQGAAKSTLELLERVNVYNLMKWIKDHPGVLPENCFFPAESDTVLQQHMSTTEIETIRSKAL